MLSALGDLPDPQVAQILLRHCAGFGKLVYSARVGDPKSHSEALHYFDAAVHECFENLSSLRVGDDHWDQATLGTREGGLGFRKLAKHSAAAFLSSRSACRELCSQLDPLHSWEIDDSDSALSGALQDYNSGVDQTNRLSAESFGGGLIQKDLSRAIDNSTLSRLSDPSRADAGRQAHLKLMAAHGAGTWVHALPTKGGNNRVDPQLASIMLARAIRAPLHNHEFFCPCCDGVVDVFGDHCLTCSGGGDRTKRHNKIRNAVYSFCAEAGLSPELERPGLLQPRPMLGASHEDGSRPAEAGEGNAGARRPADVYIPRWKGGRPAALDLAVTSGLSTEALRESARDGEAAALRYEGFKCEHLNTRTQCQSEGITFIPVVAEASGGGWAPEARMVWTDIAKLSALASGESVQSITMRLLQSLGVILHRESARAILRRQPAAPDAPA